MHIPRLGSIFVSSWVELKQTRCRVSTTLNPHPVMALSIERSRNERSRNERSRNERSRNASYK
jgi:hypothetical protein